MPKYSFFPFLIVIANAAVAIAQPGVVKFVAHEYFKPAGRTMESILAQPNESSDPLPAGEQSNPMPAHSAVHAMSPRSACYTTYCESCPTPCAVWTATAEALFLHRTQSFGGVIVVDDTNFPAPATSGDNLKFDMVAGPRLRLNRTTAEGEGFEFTYFGFQNWTASHTNPGNNDRSIPNPLGLATFDYFAADQITVAYSSEIQNAEALYACPWNDCVTLLGGVRYLALDETLNLNAVDSNTGTSDYLVNAQNDLIGGQMGARVKLVDESLLRFDATAKLGIFHNGTKQRTYMRDLNNTLVLRDYSPTDDETAFVSELNLNTHIALCDNLSLVAGYTMMWIENVALAPQQLDFTDTPTSGSDLRETAGIFLHGVNLGLEGRF